MSKTVDRQVWVDRIAVGACRLGVTVPEPDRLMRFAELLLKWNRRVRIIGPGEIEPVINDHILDGVGFARMIGRLDIPAWYDIGAGAGLPGLIVAMLLPHKRIELVEPISKKTAFMTHAAATLGIHNAKIHTTRVELLPPGGPTAAFSRATFAPDAWMDRASELVGVGGHVIVALGGQDAPHLREAAISVDDFRLPSGARRRNLLMRVGAE